jgi:hypothetical protein
MRASKTTPIEDYSSCNYFIQENHVKITCLRNLEFLTIYPNFYVRLGI